MFPVVHTDAHETLAVFSWTEQSAHMKTAVMRVFAEPLKGSFVHLTFAFENGCVAAEGPRVPLHAILEELDPELDPDIPLCVSSETTVRDRLSFGVSITVAPELEAYGTLLARSFTARGRKESISEASERGTIENSRTDYFERVRRGHPTLRLQ